MYRLLIKLKILGVITLHMICQLPSARKSGFFDDEYLGKKYEKVVLYIRYNFAFNSK